MQGTIKIAQISINSNTCVIEKVKNYKAYLLQQGQKDIHGFRKKTSSSFTPNMCRNLSNSNSIRGFDTKISVHLFVQHFDLSSSLTDFVISFWVKTETRKVGVGTNFIT